MAPDFDYDNLNPRRPTVGSRLLRLIPGVRSVALQTKPYAAWWQGQNQAALRGHGPLWVVLGDSMSQGIGASTVQRGWVPRTAQALRERGVPVRVLNLSFSGARTGEVSTVQLPALARAGVRPDAISVLIGSNDLVRQSLRQALPEAYERLLDELPSGTLVGTMPGGGLGALAPIVERHARVAAVPLRFARGEVAADRYHPDDRAYARIADAFEAPLAAALGASSLRVLAPPRSRERPAAWQAGA